MWTVFTFKKNMAFGNVMYGCITQHIPIEVAKTSAYKKELKQAYMNEPRIKRDEASLATHMLWDFFLLNPFRL